MNKRIEQKIKDEQKLGLMSCRLMMVLDIIPVDDGAADPYYWPNCPFL